MSASSIDYLIRVEDATEDDPIPVDIVAGIGPSHTFADLTAAILAHLGVSRAAADLVDAATGQAFDPGDLVAGSGLVDGTTLRLGPLTRTSRAGSASDPTGESIPADVNEPPVEPCEARIDLVVRSGPDAAGPRLWLGPGRVLIGRDRRCDLVLSDPGVSRVHAEVVVGDNGEMAIGPSTEARGPLTVDGVPIDEPVPLVAGSLVRLGGTTIGLGSDPARAGSGAGERGATGGGTVPEGGRIAFHRTPYYPAPVEMVTFEALGTIPEEAEPPRFAYLTAAAPLLLGVSMALVYSPRFLIFAGFSPIVAVAAFLEQRRRTARRRDRALARHRRHLDQRTERIEEALRRERSRRHQGAPDIAELAQRAAERSPELWVRDRRAGDLLRLRVGLGDTEPSVTIGRETRGEDRLCDELHAQLDALSVLQDVPVVVDLGSRAALGLIGDDADTTALVSSLICQAACLQSPEDLVIAAATDRSRAITDWMKWLPHVRAPSSPVDGDHLAETTAEADELIRALLVTAEERSCEGDPRLDRRWPRLLVVLDRRLEPDPAVVSRLIELAPMAGIAVIWLTSSRDRVPRQAEVIVTCRALLDGEGSLLADTDPDADDIIVDIDRLGATAATSIATDLAAVRDASSATAASALPRVVTLLEALGIERIDRAWVASQWQADRGGVLALPLGVSAAGPLLVDLVGSGPHGLLGGTSGSGKSELLTSTVAGLVALNPPDRVNILFIDYKGGALADQFRDVPHVVGSVTNLDAFLARRALTSLRAELDRRMALLQGRAKDVAEMGVRHPDLAPSSLVIVIDEFATLVKEIPEFMAGIVDVAQRGRSLGIHLLLATQRPTGAVNENILANTNLRISLRMVDTGESRSVIGSDDAAMIPVPLRGRGFVRLGPGRLTVFQAPWSGAPGPADIGPSPVTTRSFGPRRERPPATRPGPTPLSLSLAGPDRPTQLAAVLDAVIGAADELGVEPGLAPWQDELPDHLTLNDVRRAAHSRGVPVGGPTSQRSGPSPGYEAHSEQRARADSHGPPAGQPGPGRDDGWLLPIGLVDDPEAQDQYPAIVDLVGGGGLVVFGTGGSGRTTALRTVAAAAALDDLEHGSSGLTIFGLDFASRELTALTALAPCSAVATGDDLEAVTRIIALLDSELVRRRRSSAAANERGVERGADPRILVLIDDYGSLSRTFEGPGAAAALYPWLDTLNRIIVDGRQVGIHTALSATRRGSVKSSLLSAIANRIVLRQTEAGGYIELGLPGSLVADLKLPPGRGFLNGADQVQVATLAEPPRAGRTTRQAAASERDALGALGVRIAHCAHPPQLATSALPMEVGPLGPDDDADPVVVGVADLTLTTVSIDLTAGPVCILGGPRSGRSNALAVILDQAAASGRQLWLVGPTVSPLAGRFTGERTYFGSTASVIELLERLADDVEGQGEPDTAAGFPPAEGSSRPLLAIDDLDLIEDALLDKVAARLVTAGISIVATTTTMRGYTTNPLVQEVRKARTILHLQPSDSREVQELTGSHPRIRPGLVMAPGRGVLVVNRYPVVVQVVGPVLERTGCTGRCTDGTTEPPSPR